jgi:hypothetical protein
LCVAANFCAAAGDGWSKVVSLETGSELRVYRRDAKQLIRATMDEANDERIVVVVNDAQTAISKEEIERIDYRPPQTGSRVKAESKVTREVPGARADLPIPKMSGGEPRSVSSGVSIGSRPGFQTVYRRKIGLPAPR